MTEQQIHFIRGCCVTILAFAATGLLASIFLMSDEPNVPEEKFKVVDKYKNCTVVRYTDTTNRWHYLLHCGL
jgi:acyl-CoA synthetase (AMP-forming)/AMP-acid ligase II